MAHNVMTYVFNKIVPWNLICRVEGRIQWEDLMRDMLAVARSPEKLKRRAIRMKHKVPLSIHLHFQNKVTDSFFGFIQQGEEILLDVLGINRDGTLDAFALKPVPALRIEKNKIYCFAPDLKSFSPF